MDALLETLELPLEAYPEYAASLAYAFESWPAMLVGYFFIALPVAGWLVYKLSRPRPGFLRAFGLFLVLFVVVLPGAYGNGGLVFLPLGLVAALSVVNPYILLYNVGLFGAAVAAAALAAAAQQAVSRARM
jgi:hypothetical protein